MGETDIVSFRLFQVEASVTETQRSNAGFPCNIRILWKFRLFLAAVGFRGLPLAIPSLTM